MFTKLIGKRVSFVTIILAVRLVPSILKPMYFTIKTTVDFSSKITSFKVLPNRASRMLSEYVVF